MPNLNLVWLTFLGGVVWAATYQLRPNLFALAISHTFTSMILARALPNIWVNSMRVGLKYFYERNSQVFARRNDYRRTD